MVERLKKASFLNPVLKIEKLHCVHFRILSINFKFSINIDAFFLFEINFFFLLNFSN